MDLSNYLEMFIEESKEHLQSINDELLKLESAPENTSIVNEIFRSAHTLKGMAGSMGYEDLAALTHEMENVLDLLRSSRLVVSPEIMDIIFTCVDYIEKMVDNIEQGGDGKENVKNIVSKLKNIQDPSTIHLPEQSSAFEEVAATVAELTLDEYQLTIINEARKSGNHFYHIKVTLDETCIMKSIRAYLVFQAVEELGEIVHTSPSIEEIEGEKFDDFFELMLLSDQTSEAVKSKLLLISEVKEVTVSEQMTEDLIAPIEKETAAVMEPIEKNQNERVEANPIKTKRRSKSIRVDIEKLDELMNMFSELIIDKGRLEQIAEREQLQDLNETVEHLSRISGELQGLILNMRMVQVEQVFNRFPRMVRDLAKELNKKIQLVIVGEETELDRTVIDEIGDPLVHLLRNALDHGLETTEERTAANKPEEGKIQLKAYYSGNEVFIEVSDDGKGINREKVVNKAIEREILSVEEASTLTDQQVYSLLMASGFSTADKISDISGRGVGLDVVKSKIESLGGSIHIDSAPGNGTTFRIQLPLSLSIMQAMLVAVNNETYAIPFSSIDEITNLSEAEVSTLHGQKVIQKQGQIIPLIFLDEIFQVPEDGSKSETSLQSIVIVSQGNKSRGLVVDEVLGQKEVVLKSLGSYLTSLFAISGATILGNGEIALVIDSNQFFQMKG